MLALCNKNPLRQSTAAPLESPIPAVMIDPVDHDIKSGWKIFQWIPEGDEGFQKEIEKFFNINKNTQPKITLDLNTWVNNQPSFLFEKQTGRAYPCLYTILPLQAGTYSLSFQAKAQTGQKQDVLVAIAHKRDKITISDVFKKYNCTVKIPRDTPEALISFGPLYNGKSWIGDIKLVRAPFEIEKISQSKEFTPAAPPLLSLKLIYPFYKNNIYQSLPPQDIKCQALIALKKNRGEKYLLTLSLINEGKEILEKKEISLEINSGPKNIQAAFSSKNLPCGKYFICADLNSGKNIIASEKLGFSKLEKAKREITIGENGEILINGRAFFPVGIYTHKMSLDEAKELGLNLILFFKEEELSGFFEEAQKNGIEIILENGVEPDVEKIKENIEKIIREYSSYPNFAWTFVDEPDLKPKYQQALPRMKEELEKADPYIPLYTSNHSPQTFGEYIKYTDILSMDPYPIATLPRPTYTTGWWLDEAYKHFTPGKSIWAIIQAFPFYPIWKEPTPEELRFMTYQAVNHGAKGIIFYALHEILNPKAKDYKWYLKDSVLWDEVKKLTYQLKELSCVILSDNKPKIKIKYNANLDCKVWNYNGKEYLIAINMDKGEVLAQFKIIPAGNYAIKELFKEDIGGNQNLLNDEFKTKNNFQEKFKGLEVKIYEISQI